MTGRWLPRLVLALPAALALSWAAPAPRVTAVRFWSLPDVTRVAVELTGDFEYRWERLSNPERIFFDLPGVAAPVRRGRVLTRLVNDKYLARVRVAENQPGITRVVLEVAQGVSISASRLANPSRLIVEIRGARSPESPPVRALRVPPAREPVVQPPPSPVRTPKVFVPPSPEPMGTPEMPSAPRLGARAPEPPLVLLSSVPKEVPAYTPRPARKAARPSQPESAASGRPAPAKPAAPGSAGGRSLIRTLGLKINRVVIDPGHGGHDQGTEGATGLLEKDLVLDIGKRLGELIEKRLGAEVIYTRTDDTFIPLHERTALANERKADLFLSLHANSSRARSVAGVETYYLNFTESKEALDVAARENATSQQSIHELRDLIQKITLHDKAQESREFARHVQSAVYSASARANRNVQNRGVRNAPFVVLIGAVMPSVLVEVGFLSNPREEALLKRGDHRQRVAEALYRGVTRYVESLSHFQVAKSQPEAEANGAKKPDGQ
ncbi:MAG: N-acetylmuramoyl-L-alanine amidase [Bryobacterales bacterium]|nr:N-acetylmuramoyl-L-alanine amidase [Bryobacterales bacterium]